MSTVIGINFGNTASSIAVCTGSKVEVIANQDGERSIPSVLSYVGDDEYHGGQALAQLLRNPASTILGFRDYLGVPFKDIDPTSAGRGAKPIDLNGKVGYKIVKGESGEEETLSVEEVVTRHLKQLKLSAEDFIGSSIDGVVIAVPTDFTDAQKEALIKCSEKAGMKVLQLIKEPTAALLANSEYSHELNKDKLCVVADFGALRSDAAVIAVRGGILTVLATSHDYELGGKQIDAALSEFFAKEFEKKHKSNPRTNHKSATKLANAVIDAKRTLSNVTNATVAIDSLNDGFDFHTSVNRLRFEVVCRNVFSQMTEFVESIVKKAGYDVLDIDEVLLVGGSSFIPKVASNLQFVFPESVKIVAPTVLAKALDPTDLISRGCALQASLIDTFDADFEKVLDSKVVNTQHLTKALGIVDAEGKFVQILTSETAVPIRRSVKFLAGSDSVLVSVYEAERDIKETTIEPVKKEEAGNDDDEGSDWSDDDDEPEVVREKVFVAKTKLADLVLDGVSASSQIELTFDIKQNGKLTVFAREDKVGGKQVKIEV